MTKVELYVMLRYLVCEVGGRCGVADVSGRCVVASMAME
jgi:hypothetical protein